MCVCVYQFASWISKITTNSELISAIQLEGDVLSNLISLDFYIKALLSSCDLFTLKPGSQSYNSATLTPVTHSSRRRNAGIDLISI